MGKPSSKPVLATRALKETDTLLAFTFHSLIKETPDKITNLYAEIFTHLAPHKNTRKPSENRLIPILFLDALSSSEKKAADEIDCPLRLFDAGTQARQVQD
jgi:hypothetical protein